MYYTLFLLFTEMLHCSQVLNCIYHTDVCASFDWVSQHYESVYFSKFTTLFSVFYFYKHHSSDLFYSCSHVCTCTYKLSLFAS